MDVVDESAGPAALAARNTQGKSTISKLSIRGIRSFDPNHEEAIEFYSPLTMIVGANGCGKTTVIEALKYATTGALPPGARAGHSFVNDPGMTDSSEVKAQIKLRFNNSAGEVNVISRSLQLTKKAKTMAFKALDGLLRMKSGGGGGGAGAGKYTSLSMKCAELDKMVPELLGVSPPIIENVIFTHQEDSSWPMADGATLKKKFDDIFESTCILCPVSCVVCDCACVSVLLQVSLFLTNSFFYHHHDRHALHQSAGSISEIKERICR